MMANAIATIIISRWQQSLDYQKTQFELQEKGQAETKSVYASEM
ncbi:TPA: C4-dicarboxylate transporter DctA, partial [Legionella pneumophila]|nr:C4-dicarboxylate transporter DctA [Legionella pneumophila]HAT1815531.1 C4-dicarboxylate transporter DctA [Legionella pneumophila]